MALTYFGHCESDGSFKSGQTPADEGNGWNGETIANNHSVIPFTCPGSGSQELKELSLYCKSSGGTAGNIRLAVYSSDLSTLIAQGSAEVAISSTTASWYGHVAFVNQGGSPITALLTGGTAYVLAVSIDGADTHVWGWEDWGSYYGKEIGSDYTGGFPSSLASGTNFYTIPTVRAGVDPVSGIERTSLGTWSSSTNFGTGQYTIGSSFTPDDNSLLVVVASMRANGGSGDPSVDLTISDSESLTWTPQGNGGGEDYDPWGFRVWTAPISIGTSMTVSIDCGSRDVNQYFVQAFCYTGYNTSSPIGGKNTGTNTSATDGATTITLDATPEYSSMVVAVISRNGVSPITTTEGANWAEIYDQTPTGEYPSTQSQDRTGLTSTTIPWADVNANSASVYDAARAVAFEIKRAAEISYPQGSVCWGHSTSVTEDNARTFASNWTGTGTISGSGDSEVIELLPGEYMESEVIEIGVGNVTLTQNQYGSGDNETLKYKTGSSAAECESDTWHTYSAPFASTGFIQVRIER